MQLEYELTTQDYINCNLNYLARTPSVRRSKQQFIVVPSLLFLFLAVFSGLTDSSAAAIPFLLLAAVWLGIALPLWKQHVNYYMKKFIKASREYDLFGRRTFEITPTGFISAGEDTKVEIKWKRVKEVVAGEHGVYVYISPKVAHIIPNSAFVTQTQREEFLEATMRYREQAAGLITL